MQLLGRIFWEINSHKASINDKLHDMKLLLNSKAGLVVISLYSSYSLQGITVRIPHTSLLCDSLFPFLQMITISSFLRLLYSLNTSTSTFFVCKHIRNNTQKHFLKTTLMNAFDESLTVHKIFDIVFLRDS